MTSLADKAIALHEAFDAAGLPHAFGGALALAWCTRRPRGTSDIDLNVFVPPESVPAVLDALPDEVTWRGLDVELLERDGQARLWWDRTPVDLFLNTSDFHREVQSRVVLEPFGDEMVPFLSCGDLAVFKAFFDRRRDWGDLEEMLVARSVAVASVIAVLTEILGTDDGRIAKLREIAAENGHGAR